MFWGAACDSNIVFFVKRHYSIEKSTRFGSFLGPSAGAAAGASVVSLADSSDGNGGEQDTLDIVQILNGAQLGREFRKVFVSVIVNG